MVNFEKAGSPEIEKCSSLSWLAVYLQLLFRCDFALFAFMLNGHKFKNTNQCDIAASSITMHIKGSCLLCRNISSAAGCFLQHKCLPGVFWARLYGTMSGNEVLWHLLLFPQVWKNKTLTACILLSFWSQCYYSSPSFLPQIPQTGLGPSWNGWQQSPIWNPHRRRRERKRHPLRPC